MIVMHIDTQVRTYIHTSVVHVMYMKLYVATEHCEEVLWMLCEALTHHYHSHLPRPPAPPPTIYSHSLQHAHSEMGCFRAWIRLAVNECSLESYVNVLVQDTNLMRQAWCRGSPAPWPLPHPASHGSACPLSVFTASTMTATPSCITKR